MAGLDYAMADRCKWGTQKDCYKRTGKQNTYTKSYLNCTRIIYNIILLLLASYPIFIDMIFFNLGCAKACYMLLNVPTKYLLYRFSDAIRVLSTLL